jgi:hypothetical protein
MVYYLVTNQIFIFPKQHFNFKQQQQQQQQQQQPLSITMELGLMQTAALKWSGSTCAASMSTTTTPGLRFRRGSKISLKGMPFIYAF